MAIIKKTVEFKTFFLGEFGLLNWSILGMLAQLAKDRPNYVFFVSTFPDYLVLMQKVSPNIRKLEVDFDIIKNNNQRDKKRSEYKFDEKVEQKFFNKEIINLSDILIILTHSTSSHLEKPIVPLCNKLKTNFVIPNGKYISVFCRQRKHENFRNLSPDVCIKILTAILKIPEYENHKIIFHGLPNESKYLNESFSNSYNCTNIEEAIGYLEKSDFLLSAVLSGYTQFASNCGTNVINVGHLWKSAGPMGYNPFNKILEFAKDAEDTLEIIKKLKSSLITYGDEYSNLENLEKQNGWAIEILDKKRSGYFLYIGNNKSNSEKDLEILKNRFNWKGLYVESKLNSKNENSINLIPNIFEKNYIPKKIDIVIVDCEKESLLLFVMFCLKKYYTKLVIINHQYKELDRSNIKLFLENNGYVHTHCFINNDCYINNIPYSLTIGSFKKFRKKIDKQIGITGSFFKKYQPKLYLYIKNRFNF